jgi:putative nucleotidyltransferase with HDIG domain
MSLQLLQVFLQEFFFLQSGISPADTDYAAMQNRVLFVDDDPLLRDSYSGIGPALRQAYEIVTAANGKEGVALLTGKRFDVVVADLTMPGMDGVQFLGHVVRTQPDSARIIISGYLDRAKISQCLFVGHRYFNKPCDLRALSDLLLRLAGFRNIVSNQKVREVIGGIGSLPGPPETYVRLEEVLNSAYSSLNDVAKVVETDLRVTAKLLQIVNSAQFGVARQIVSPTEAVQLVGVEVVRGLVLGLQAFSVYKTNKKDYPADLWDHSLRIALAARRIAQAQGLSHEQCEKAFLGGLLHDIGKIVLIANVPEEYTEIRSFASKCRISLAEAEHARYAATHAQIGAYLLALWGIQEDVVQIVEYHHSLADFPVAADFGPLAAVHAAHVLESKAELSYPLNHELLSQRGLAGIEKFARETAAVA